MESGLSIFIQSHYEADGVLLSCPANLAEDGVALCQDAPTHHYGRCFSIASTEVGACAWRIVVDLWRDCQGLWLTVKSACGKVRKCVAQIFHRFAQSVPLAGRDLLARVRILRI